MKTVIKIIFVLILIASSVIYFRTEDSFASKRAGCEVYIYIANNSRFDCKIQIDGIQQVGSMLPSKVKTYTTDLPNDTPRKIKVKVIYDDPDYMDPKSYILLTHKLECGQTDSLYIAHTK